VSLKLKDRKFDSLAIINLIPELFKSSEECLEKIDAFDACEYLRVLQSKETLTLSLLPQG
jgi:hypothetical protein